MVTAHNAAARRETQTRPPAIATSCKRQTSSWYNNMKIGICTDGYPGFTAVGGIATYTRELAHGLCSLGHDVHVLTAALPAATVRDGPVWVHSTRADYFPVVERLVPGSGACYYIGTAITNHGQRPWYEEGPRGGRLREVAPVGDVDVTETQALPHVRQRLLRR